MILHCNIVNYLSLYQIANFLRKHLQYCAVSDALTESVNWTAMRKRATSIYHTTMTNNQYREDDIVDSLEREIDLEDSSPQDIDEAVRTMPTTLSRKRNIKWV